MPAQNPATSKQDFETPPDFLAALEARWGRVDFDLACREDNCKANSDAGYGGGYFWPKYDSLDQPWAHDHRDQNLWLNPEFGNIEPFAAKCAFEGPMMRRGRIFLLTPASIGTNWFAKHVNGRAMVLGISPRITFVGAAQGYPKDLMLSIFAPGMNGFDTWRWKD